MLKQTGIISKLLIIATLLSGIALLFSGIALLSLRGCEPEDNPKLSSILNKLIQAEEQGEADEFARPRGIELLYDDAGLVSVRVEIQCSPEKVEEAAEVVGTYGTVEIVISRGVQAIVPLASLPALADEESIRSIRWAEPGE